ncbi:MAG: transglycosylase domain-containing protein [Pseudomonadota bacterium]|nr:transglycosylase domain-containing protein [Pseudomonadota bacterium]
MAWRRATWRYSGFAALGLFAALAAYELFALHRAGQATPQVLAAAAQGELTLEDLPPRRVDMLLRVEDPGFYRHRGVDFSTPGAGMTSITQSLVKRFYFDNFEPGFAKLEQSLIARFVLHPAMSKRAQLEAYLNHSHFGAVKGRRVVGLADAARSFYGREIDDLSDRQFLSLVAMMMAPKTYDPLRQPRANADRVRRIEAMLAGRCAAQGLRDVALKACGAA